MKTLINTSALLVTLIILTTASLNVSALNLSEELYIADNSFDTKCVINDCRYTKAVSVDFQFEEEQYIDDIPFNTECVTSNCLYKKAMLEEFNFEEEGCIYDMR